MGESSVRNWIRGIRFTPENYDKSVFYVDHHNHHHDQNKNKNTSYPTNTDNERKQTMLQFNNNKDDNTTTGISFLTFKPQGATPAVPAVEKRKFVVVPSSCNVLETIEEYVGISTRSACTKELPESENHNYGGDNPVPVASESKTPHHTNHQLDLLDLDLDVVPSGDDELLGSDCELSSNESCSMLGNTHGFLITQTNSSIPQQTSLRSNETDEKVNPSDTKSAGKVAHEIPPESASQNDYGKGQYCAFDCYEEPIYVNLAQLKNTSSADRCTPHTDKSPEDEDEDDFFDITEESVRRRPAEGFKRNTKSLRRKRYAIMDKSLKFNAETKRKSVSNVFDTEWCDNSVCSTPEPDSTKKSNESLDSISWKSAYSTFMIDDDDNNISPKSDDASFDSVSWKSSNSFALVTKNCEEITKDPETQDKKIHPVLVESLEEDTRKTEQLLMVMGSTEEKTQEKGMLTDPLLVVESPEEETRKKTILTDFKKHAVLETFSDPIYMNHRQIMQPYSYIQECIPEPTYEIGNVSTSTTQQNKKESGSSKDLTFATEVCNNETSEISKSETIDDETYQNIWECNSSNNSKSNKSASSGNSKGSGCSFLEAKRWSVKHALVCKQSIEYEIVHELLVAPITFAQVAFGNVVQWQKDLEAQYCSEEDLFQEYTSLESINEKKDGVSPFPTECDVEIRKKSVDRTVTNRSQTIHGCVSELENSIEEESPLNMRKVVKIYIDGTGRKILKNQILQIYKGEMALLSEKGEREILRRGVNITHYKPYTNKKEIHITNTTAEECKLYKLQFDNTEDMNIILGELHNYFNNDFKDRPRSNSLTDSAPLPPQNEERVQRKHRLLNLLGMRSAKDVLEKKGIIRNEPIFGNTLNNLYKKYHEPVPPFVVKTIKIIELPKNIRSLGLYRASGNLATIQKIRFQVDRNNLSILNDYMNDIDVLTGALKLFFRELNEPVIPHKTYEELLQFVDKQLHPGAIEKMKYSINKMDLPHKKTFLTLLKHLVYVEKFKQENKMDAYNISIVWGPTLIWPPETSQENILENHTNANKIIEILLNIYRDEFLSETESSPPFSVRNRNNVNAVLNYNSQAPTKSSKKDLQENSAKTSPKSKFGSMENLFKSMKKDTVSSPKDTKWSLENLCKNSNVPEFLLRIIPLIEKSSEVENMYSRHLSVEKMEKIKTKIFRNKFGSLEKNNVYELAASVKLFFSELDPPLIPTESLLRMVHAVGKQSEPEKSMLMRQEINKLSPCHRETLSYLFKHLVEVGRRRGSYSVNMAVAWMPILCKKLIDASNIRLEKCVEVVENLIEFYDEKTPKTDAYVENLKNNLKTKNQKDSDTVCVKALINSINNNDSNCESLSKQQEKNNNNNNSAPTESTVKKRIPKNTSALYRERDSKHYTTSTHPPSIYDTVPPTQTGISRREEVRGEAKLLETDTNKNVKQKHERTTKL